MAARSSALSPAVLLAGFLVLLVAAFVVAISGAPVPAVIDDARCSFRCHTPSFRVLQATLEAVVLGRSGSSCIQHRQVESGEPGGIGEDVDLDDPAAADREAHR